tara:strand:- start:304 stop:825 length:522 start_codon:yes stop_codon:yes gene_type:complete
MARIGEQKNYYIWDKAKSTDPSWTKPFPKFGKTLTTIDPMSQVMCMTGLFGPVGKGWRFKNTFTYTDQNVFSEVVVQWKENEQWYAFGPISSVCALYKKAGTLDDEACKKASTDALTKAFSYLGLNADVFLGMFDNNKYVSEMKTKFSSNGSTGESNVKVIDPSKLRSMKDDK